MRRIGTAVGQYVASPVVESMDVNAILEHVDWNEVLEKIDPNALLDGIDVDKLLDRVDWNRHLDRVDVDRHLGRVDYDAIIQRFDLEDVVARSTSGVVSGFSNLLRTRMAWVDQWGQRICRCYCCCSKQKRTKKKNQTTDGALLVCPVEYLPPRPGRPEDSWDVWKNPSELDKATFGRSIQFRTSGAFNRLVYSCIDSLVTWITFGTLTAIVQTLGGVFTENRDWLEGNPVASNPFFDPLLFYCLSNVYWIFLVGCFGRTLGMWVLGLLMVSKEGDRLSFCQVITQAILDSLDILLFGWVIGFFRRDGAFLSDLLGGVNIIYAWDVRHITSDNANIALSMNDFVDPLTEQERKHLLVDDDDDDDDDDVDVDDSGFGDIEIPELLRASNSDSDSLNGDTRYFDASDAEKR